jgi:diguanylate cyclase (GGDEF)-like protein
VDLVERLPPRGSAAAVVPEARLGGLLIISGGLISISMAGLDPRPWVNLTSGAIGLVLGIICWSAAHREMPRAFFLTFSILATTLISSVAASIKRPDDLGTGPILYVWVIVHAALFFSPRECKITTAWCCALYTAIVLVELPAPSALAAAATTSIGLAAILACTYFLRDGIDDLVAQLSERAHHDTLTGLLNRQGLVECLAADTTGRGALLVLDVDHFKEVNDRYGHSAGDATLAWLGAVLASEGSGHTDRPAVPARFGGEEFVVWLPGMDEAEGVRWAEDMRARVERESQSRLWAVTVSVGVGAGDTSDLMALLNRADHALYQAKDSGRNAVRVAAGNVPAPRTA